MRIFMLLLLMMMMMMTMMTMMMMMLMMLMMMMVTMMMLMLMMMMLMMMMMMIFSQRLKFDAAISAVAPQVQAGVPTCCTLLEQFHLTHHASRITLPRISMRHAKANAHRISK